jgi:hypothetical protein
MSLSKRKAEIAAALVLAAICTASATYADKSSSIASSECQNTRIKTKVDETEVVTNN